MLLLRDGTEVSTPELIGLGPTRHAIFLCQQSGATGGQAWKGPGYGRGYGAWHSPSSTDIEAKHSTKTVWVKSGQGFVGQRLTGNRGSFFPLFGTSGKGGWADWNQRTTEKGQEPTSKKVIPTTHIPLENGQCIFPFFPFPHQLHDVGARGAKELGGLCPGNNSRDEAKHTCHPPTPGRLHHLTHTHTHTTTHKHAQYAGWSALQIDRSTYGFRRDWVFCFCRVPPLPPSWDSLHASCTKFVGFFFFFFWPVSLSLFPVRVTSSFPCELFIMSHT